MPKSSAVKEKFFLCLCETGKLKVTKSGRVFNTKTGRELASNCPFGKYRIVSYQDPDSKIIYKILVHRLVWIVFKGIPDDHSLEVNHKDGNKANCSLSNLELSTSYHNNQHARKLGLVYVLRGDDRPNAIFSDEEVLRYRRLFSKDKTTIRAIAAKHRCHSLTVRQMLQGKTYSHL
jgi:hypothetical protein